MFDETLRRAADGDAEALQRLIELSLPLIRRKCPPDLRSWIDDIQQIVAYRLIRKFRSVTNPYRVSTFAAYCSFVNRTTLNVSRNIWRYERRSQSLEELNATTGFDPARRSEADQVNARLRMERCLQLLYDPLAREVFRRRFFLQESVEETTLALRRQGMQVTTKHVYRVAERSILHLSKLPEVREMFETAGVDD
jgi:hypothetical protein